MKRFCRRLAASALSGLLLPAAVAAQVPSAGAARGARPAAADDLPAIEAAPVANAPMSFDYSAKVTLDRDAIQGKDAFETASRQMFDAYLAHEKIRGIAASVARRKFAAVAPWNLEFAQAHADSLTLSFDKAEIAGRKRFAQRTDFDYNGKKITVYRYRDGFQSASSVFIDGKETKGEDGEPLQFFTKDRESFDKFVGWFEGELGRPPAR